MRPLVLVAPLQGKPLILYVAAQDRSTSPFRVSDPISEDGYTIRSHTHLRLEELESLDERRLDTQQRLECYQSHISKSYNKKVRQRSFQVGDMVLSVRRPIITHKKGKKFVSKWDGPYVILEVYTNGSYMMVDQDGVKVGPINGRYLKLYYP
ncbi:hypothetical protein LIER_05269 [Lithospermum erythrorhizon]|uniref:Uncharacterized protein n=1 Tax=Lithospermum erythrorhizon TaxID=34254 RepID=A0AAV3P4R4_LITER